MQFVQNNKIAISVGIGAAGLASFAAYKWIQSHNNKDTNNFPIPRFLSKEAREFLRRATVLGGKIENPEEYYKLRKYYQQSTQDVSDREKRAWTCETIARSIQGVRALEVTPRSYQSNNKRIIYIHGGAWTLGDPSHLYQNFAKIAFNTSQKVIAVAYRLAPEHPFPAGLDDCARVYTHLIEKEGILPENITLLGDSAGGNLCFALALKLKALGKDLPGKICAISPATDLEKKGDSYFTLKGVDPQITYEETVAPHLPYYAPNENLKNPLLSPVYGNFYGDFPKTSIHVGGREVLLSDATRLAEILRYSGVETDLHVYEGLWHCAMQEGFTDTERIIKSVTDFINREIDNGDV